MPRCRQTTEGETGPGPARRVFELAAMVRSSLSAIVEPGSGYIVLDYPLYCNVGDHLIWLGERALLEELHGRAPLMGIAPKIARPENRPAVPPESIVYISGGGNFGDLYSIMHRRKLAWIDACKGRRVIQLPQTLYFDEGSRLLDETCRTIEAHGDFHIMLRDQRSLDFARRHLPCESSLCPDMAFGLAGRLRPWQAHEARQDVLFLLRRDTESGLPGNSDSGQTHDWAQRTFGYWPLKQFLHLLRRVSSRLELRVMDAWSEARRRAGEELVRKGKVVVSDRLHVHILSLLLGEPHVMIDNNYGKISGFMETWETQGASSLLAASLDEAVTLARDMAR